jgi:hypothetical protein
VSKLFRLALDSLHRQRERTAFTVLDLALAIATVVIVLALPWTKDITLEQWITYMGGLMAAFAISGIVVWVLGLRRASSVSAEADLAQYAVEEG